MSPTGLRSKEQTNRTVRAWELNIVATAWDVKKYCVPEMGAFDVWDLHIWGK